LVANLHQADPGADAVGLALAEAGAPEAGLIGDQRPDEPVFLGRGERGQVMPSGTITTS
jgi:hypothetical protein